MNVGGRGRNVGLGPSNPAAAPRALLLVAVALVIGLVLLWKAVDNDVGIVVVPEPAGGDVSVQVDETPDVVDTEVPADSADVIPTTEAPPVTTTTAALLFPSKSPSEVKVLVANGSGIGGAAGAVTDMLNPRGYALESPANANPTDVSGVYYRASFADDARMVMEVIAPGNPDLLSQMPSGGLSVPDGTLDRLANADVVVILGSDGIIYAG
ncbi:MAG: LytR C-terminal domain-containing protein [Acidimicrobiia bacterium]|nr:LytR C-terminal domain-containing protein [Actinomycetota bacterium]MBL6923984.1 LytR C-terminal domain-containing protein [Acidimicrobiia bacterium]MBL6926545.1 LytR C-terminal domain-containing protein [Acidimicrobiia bacterium]